jgi:tetratricopeptide (TPR) repeat protein
VHNQHITKLEYELSKRHEKFAASTPYEIFEVWEGCGRDTVQMRYYELVKTHHPDRYGGNMTSKLKKLSQSIFLYVQDAYQTLSSLEDGPQRVGPPNEERAKALASLSSAPKTPPHTPTIPKPDPQAKVTQSSQYRRMRRSDVNNRLSNKSIFEAVTISERDASTLEEDSLPEEERRAKLAKLARTARSKTTRPPIVQVLAHQGSLEEDSSLSLQERRDKLAALTTRQKPVLDAFSSERTPSKPGLSFDSVPLADIASSGNIRGLSSHDAMRQASVSAHQEDFSKGVAELREARYRNAFELVERAYKAKPDEMRYKTYFAYLLFMVDVSKKDEAEAMLKDILELKNKQTAPDAHLFIGYIYKASDKDRDQQRAFSHFKKALALNPSNHEAAREVRLHEMRNKQEAPRLHEDVGGFFKKLFKK